jgi:hypothetical protein
VSRRSIGNLMTGARLREAGPFHLCARSHTRRVCLILFRLLHTTALLLIALSALLYLSAATGVWREHARTADLFGCASRWSINAETEGDHDR